MLHRKLLAALALGVAGLLALGDARADAIDGTWCAGDGRTLSIEGPKLVTPGGTRMTGRYTRHAFSYVIPPAEPYAGIAVDMVLLDEESLRLKVALPDAESEVWTRCDFTS